jgi:hypothetical protein
LRAIPTSFIVSCSIFILFLLLFSASQFTPVVAAGDDFHFENPITAAPPISRPNTTSCTVIILNNVSFGLSSGPHGFVPFIGTYSPPSQCGPPWSKVVLDVYFTVQNGTQFDRLGAIWVGNVEIFRTSTAEPAPSFTPTWHVAKDVSEYAPIFESPQTVAAIVTNYVVDGFNSQIFVTANLTFYETSSHFPPLTHPNLILPVSSLLTPSSPPSFILTTSNLKASANVTVPGNATQAYLEVYATGHSCDEFWYANQPTSFAQENGLCGGGAFREIQVMIDGRLAGVVWPFPFIYTGGWNPYLWSPIPSVDALDIPAYVVDLTPFLGILANGAQHVISFMVLNNYNYWVVDGNLLIYETSGAGGGEITEYNMSSNPTLQVVQQVNNKSALFDTTANRSITLAGTVSTPQGIVTTIVQENMTFTNDQVLNLRNFLENLNGSEKIMTSITTIYPNGTTSTVATTDSYPLAITSAFIIPSETAKGVVFILPATVQLSFIRITAFTVNGVSEFASSLSDTVHGKAVLKVGSKFATNGQTSESYIYNDSTGTCFNHFLAAAQGQITTNTIKDSCS